MNYLEKSPPFIKPEIYNLYPNLIAGQSTRHGGVSFTPFDSLNLSFSVGDKSENVQINRMLLCKHLGISEENLVTSTQVHGSDCLIAEKPGHFIGYDAIITNKPNLFVSVSIADCVPILIYDPVQKVVGAVHAGWKGTQLEIVKKTIQLLTAIFETRASDCRAYIGTSIKANDYEIGYDVAQHFSENYLTTTTIMQKWFLDLPKANYDQLIKTGVSTNNIETSVYSTYSDSEHFFSYRKSKAKTGRMMAIIGLKS